MRKKLLTLLQPQLGTLVSLGSVLLATFSLKDLLTWSLSVSIGAPLGRMVLSRNSKNAAGSKLTGEVGDREMRTLRCYRELVSRELPPATFLIPHWIFLQP